MYLSACLTPGLKEAFLRFVNKKGQIFVITAMGK